jgi:hypothetical protein
VTWHNRVDTRRKAPRWAFLEGGSVPLGLDEDDPVAMTVVTTIGSEHHWTF